MNNPDFALSETVRHALTPDEGLALAEAVSGFPELALSNCKEVPPSALRELRTKLSADKRLTGLIRFLGNQLSLGHDELSGLAIVSSLPLQDLLLDHPVVATALTALIGTPFKMCLRYPAWQKLETKLDCEVHRFGGTGHQPFHIDGVNVEIPPDYVCLACVRSDPMGGGLSTLSNLQKALAVLPLEDRTFFEQEIFEEGKFFDLYGVGQEKRPFAVIGSAVEGFHLLRFTGKILPGMDRAHPHFAPFKRFSDILESQRLEMMLEPGDLLVFQQRKFAHGRTSLGPGQDRLDISKRRYLRQGFIRDPRSWRGASPASLPRPLVNPMPVGQRAVPAS
ncbi:MAG: TauD/TfdA family dioxygenase [Pseudomonadota bacterium]